MTWWQIAIAIIVVIIAAALLSLNDDWNKGNDQ